MNKKIISGMLALLLLIGTILLGFGGSHPVLAETAVAEAAAGGNAKYVFFFIGDGMSHVQVNAAQVYRGNNTPGEVNLQNLNFTEFEVNGLATTHDSTSFAPDSASTATAYSCGVKTHSGVIGLDADRVTKPENLTSIFKKMGKSIGIVSSVTINHATPAAFYAAVESRSDYYGIAEQMAESGFEYFGGGTISQATGMNEDQADAYDLLEAAGYKVCRTNEDIQAISSADEKVYAVTPVTQDSGAMPYEVDRTEDDLALADYVSKGIDVLSTNENGFFMMIEAGKIDWACHANDAKAAIHDVFQLEDAVQVALDFAAEHPGEVLIVVTGDHETGGLSIGQAGTGYDTAFDLLAYQQQSYVSFDEQIKAMKEENGDFSIADVMPLITESFGLVTEANRADAADERLVLNTQELDRILAAFAESKRSVADQQFSLANDPAQYIHYGGYDPLSVTLTHILNNKAGIGWTSYAHTGTPVPFFATGAGAENFAGSYDNIDVYQKFIDAVG